MTEGAQGLASAEQMATWRALYRLDALLSARLEQRLRDAVGITLLEREVLDALHRNGARLRMSALAGELVMSRSGTTRLVARMVKHDWVQRESSPQDGRATWAVLTSRGQAVLQRAQPVVDLVVSSFFGPDLADGGLKHCAALLDTLCRANQVPVRSELGCAVRQPSLECAT
ncbi:MarR family winged helix-turn-helix transcriptional regulator [Mycobacterium sp. C31M]